MTMFAPDTPQGYANAYNNWFYGGGARSGQPSPKPQDYGMPGASGPKPQAFPGKSESQPGKGSSYNPGKAQSIQMPSYGTGYGQRAPEMYAPRETLARAQGAPPGGVYPDDMVPVSGWGNLAYAPPDQRPPPFQAVYGQIGGGYSSQPNFDQRDAFISNINNQLGQMQQQSWARPGSVGAPQMDLGRMWGQAGEMVQQGWQSPLAGLFGR